jgi:hypothetical protein
MALQANHWRPLGRLNLRIDEASEASSPSSWIKRGTENEGPEARAAVVLVQEALIAAGCSIPAGVTGTFGNQTVLAVQALQADRRNNLSRDSGIVGPDVLRVLDRRMLAVEVSATTTGTQPPGVYEFVIEGRRYRTEGNDLDSQFNRVNQAVLNHLQAAIDQRNGFVERQTAIVRLISDALGNSQIPSERILLNGIHDCAEAWQALARRDYNTAELKIKRAIFRYELNKGLWQDYLRGTNVGARRAQTALGHFSDVALLLSTTVLSGGIAAELQLGFGATAVATGAISAEATAIRELAVQSHERIIQLDPEANWRAMASTISTSGAASFCSSVVGGWLRPYAIRYVGSVLDEALMPTVRRMSLSDDLFSSVNEILVMGGARPVSRSAFVPTLDRVAGRVLTSLPQSVVSAAAQATITQLGTGTSLERFLRRWWQNLPRDALARAIAQAILGVAVPN